VPLIGACLLFITLIKSHIAFITFINTARAHLHHSPSSLTLSLSKTSLTFITHLHHTFINTARAAVLPQGFFTVEMLIKIVAFGLVAAPNTYLRNCACS